MLQPIQSTSIIRSMPNSAAFNSNHHYHHLFTRKTNLRKIPLWYQIEPIDSQRVSSTDETDSTKGYDNDSNYDEGVGGNHEMSITDQSTDLETTHQRRQQQQLGDSENVVEDNKDWISATRTLGSLILHLKDETRDSNVDVFGRPLNLQQIDQFGLVKDTDNGGGFTTQFAKILLKLKRDEEDNRERIFKENKGRIRDDSGDEEGSSKLPINLHLDQVRWLYDFCLVSFSPPFVVVSLAVWIIFTPLLWSKSSPTYSSPCHTENIQGT